MFQLYGFRIPRLVGVSLQVPGFSAVHGLAPWMLSRAGKRYGWTGDAPEAWNLPGLLLVTIGFGIFVWCLHEHFAAAPGGWQLEKTAHYPTPAYLITSGPYRYSRNPIYVAEGVIWAGWIVFFGSLMLCAVFAAAALLLGPFVLAREERGLQARFGDAYRAYREKTPRWIGVSRHR